MNNISDKLSQMSTGWVVLFSLVVFIVFVVFVLPGQSAKADEVAEDAGTPDLSFMYSTGDLYKMAEAYGEQGRADYVKARFTFDLVWPIVYTFFLVTTISFLFGKAAPADSNWQRANLVPLFAMALDYLENISTSIVMARYPTWTPVVDVLATIFTPLKWIFVGIGFLLLLTGILLALLYWIRSNR